jgi:hypothetical protein
MCHVKGNYDCVEVELPLIVVPVQTLPKSVFLLNAFLMVEAARCKVWSLWWMGKTLPVKLLQELCCDIGCMGADVVEKGHFFCEQTKVFHPDDIVQVLHCCAVVVCI